MSVLSAAILAVMFLLEPEERVDVARAREISRDADRVETEGASAPSRERNKRAHIMSETGDFDQQAGVALFEGHVVLTYEDDCVLCADRLWAFMAESNRLDRVVVTGNVSITNDTRVGTCGMATFRRSRGEIEMFAGEGNVPAKLVEQGQDASVLEGRRIKFWIDAEQVEVDSSRITTQTEANGKILK